MVLYSNNQLYRGNDIELNYGGANLRMVKRSACLRLDMWVDIIVLCITEHADTIERASLSTEAKLAVL